MATERTVIHLQIADKHYYFGSVANIYEYFSKDDLGITHGSLRNYCITESKPFQNSKCIIRKGKLLQKAGNRGKNTEKSQ